MGRRPARIGCRLFLCRMFPFSPDNTFCCNLRRTEQTEAPCRRLILSCRFCSPTALFRIFHQATENSRWSITQPDFLPPPVRLTRVLLTWSVTVRQIVLKPP